MAGRLRIPKALAVALLGSTTTVAVSFSGCDVPQKTAHNNPDPSAVPDASIDGSEIDTPDTPDDVADAMLDARPDAAIDARPDAAIDARPDAAIDARPDAPIV
jgi:hypothetical protein